MIVVWVLLVAVGLAVSILSSGRALTAAEKLGLRMGLSPHVIGLTIVAIGTDLPEVANSIIASAEGRGDLNVGDSTGSAATQITLVVGVLCLLRPLPVKRRLVAISGALIVAGFALAALVLANGELSRSDGALLVGAWVVASFVVYRTTGFTHELESDMADTPAGPSTGPWILTARTLLWLTFVAGGATVAVTAFGRMVDDLGVPEYATSFILLALGTSLPELIVNGKAVRAGMTTLAVGGLLGSTLLDATLSLGIGPLLFPTDVSDAAAQATLIVGAIVAAAVLLLLRADVHGKLTGALAIGLYLMLYPTVIG